VEGIGIDRFPKSITNQRKSIFASGIIIHRNLTDMVYNNNLVYHSCQGLTAAGHRIIQEAICRLLNILIKIYPISQKKRRN